MIYSDVITIDGKQYRHTRSDTYTIERDGVEYVDAIDPIEIERHYVETNNFIGGSENITGNELLAMLEERL